MKQNISKELPKKMAAKAAIDKITPHLKKGMVIGVGTGTTTKYFIDFLSKFKGEFLGCVASSKASEEMLISHGIEVFDLNNHAVLDYYIDGADEFNNYLQLIKGGGAALTREKIIASVAKTFICIADESKKVNVLGKFPLPIEVIPMARSYVARQIVKIGGDPEYRQGIITDNGNIILDIWNMELCDPIDMETKINHITGVVTNGLFAKRAADILIYSDGKEVQEIKHR